jgi:hypothetical protein
MNIPKTSLNLSLLAGFLMAIVSAAGIFLPSVYAKEHISWASQGYGQDIINLFVIFPALLVSAYLIKRGSTKSILVWLGLLVYMAYSYMLYAFFMHFGAWFLIYIAVLGISFYALLGAIVNLSRQINTELSTAIKWPSIYLLANGLIFGVLWIMEITPRLIDGTAPKSAADVGLWINPVHVMDLAFLLPAMILAGILLWKRRSMGFLLAVPLMVFAIAMATAILSMITMLNIRNVIDSIGPAPMMVVNVLVGIYLTYQFLKEMKEIKVL